MAAIADSVGSIKQCDFGTNLCLDAPRAIRCSRGPGPRLGVAWRAPAASQIPRPVFERIDNLRAVPRVARFFRPVAAEVLEPASEPGGVFGQNGSIGIAGHKIG